MSRNEALFERAQQTIPGGVNSPVRAFRSVGGTPRFIERAQGPYFWDADGKQYIDYIGSWGPMILGHGYNRTPASRPYCIDGGCPRGKLLPGRGVSDYSDCIPFRDDKHKERR